MKKYIIHLQSFIVTANNIKEAEQYAKDAIKDHSTYNIFIEDIEEEE